jgi:hypothetical protein
MKLPSKRASDTSSLVTFNAPSKIAIFCDLLGSKTLFSNSTVGKTGFLVTDISLGLGAKFNELQPNRVHHVLI